MTIWSTGGLGGYDASPVELTGRIVGKRPGEWRFDDGVSIRWLPRQYIQKYVYLTGGYCIVTLPSWLASRKKFRMKRNRFATWASIKKR